ncbi:DUF58 domain-containing protein [Virgibacillus kekensis]|uniref:DUF58 domain-containing protein n=1 Tax=Virgibacillus kekensis TaxID=202261 RepID=A0ABV9DIE8_9BACI
MMWHRKITIMYFVPLLVAAATLLLISLYAKSAIMILITFLILLANAIPYYYLKKTTENVSMANPIQKVKLFNDEEHIIKLSVKNFGRLPVFNGLLSFNIGNSVWCPELTAGSRNRTTNQFSFRFNLLSKKSLEFTIKVQGKKRGVARVSSIKLHTKDLLGVGTLDLDYQPFFQTEVIVYPELRPVGGMDQLRRFQQGNRPMQFSLFEDKTATMGTRDYSSGDSFSDIHWKASARSNELQTKQYEKTSGMHWTFILNLSRDRTDVSTKSDDLEKNISYVAYLCKYAATNGIPYDIFVNIKVHGKDYLMHLNAGEGREQLAKALEMLARINLNSILVAEENMLAFIDRVMYRSPMIILVNCGKRESEQRFYQRWIRRGTTLFEVEQKEDAAFIVPASAGKRAIS